MVWLQLVILKGEAVIILEVALGTAAGVVVAGAGAGVVLLSSKDSLFALLTK